MRHSILSLFLGLTATAAVWTPITVKAQSFDYNRVTNISARPIESNDILYLFGDQSQNEGYVAFSNEDPNAPDAGHIGRAGAFSGGRVAYYAAGRELSPDPSGANRSANLENLAGFPNFSNYLNSNNISLSSIGLGLGPRSDRDLTQTWNLGEDQLGQDWFVSPDTTVEQSIYRANPDDVEIFLNYGENRIITFGYSDIYIISEINPDPTIFNNWNIFLSDPVPVFRVAGLDPIASGLADAFLLDVAAAGGNIQFVSEYQPQLGDISFSNSNGYDVFTLSFPINLRAVSSTSIPEPSSILGLLMFGAIGAVARITQHKEKRE